MSPSCEKSPEHEASAVDHHGVRATGRSSASARHEETLETLNKLFLDGAKHHALHHQALLATIGLQNPKNCSFFGIQNINMDHNLKKIMLVGAMVSIMNN